MVEENQLLAQVDFVRRTVTLCNPPDACDSPMSEFVGHVYLKSSSASTVGTESLFRGAVPLTDIDSANLTFVEVTFRSEPEAQAFVRVRAAAGEVQSDPPEQLIRDVGVAMLEAARGTHPKRGPASMRGAAAHLATSAPDALRIRIYLIEDAVRRGLSDEHLGKDDLVALTRYGDRLALVDTMTSALRRAPPTILRAEGRPPARVVAPDPPSSFDEQCVQVAQDARDAVTRLSTLVSTQSVVIARRQAQETERFQRAITVIGASVLVPSVVASVFGANVRVPGQGTGYGLTALLLVMLGGALMSLGLLRLSDLGLLNRLALRYNRLLPRPPVAAGILIGLGVASCAVAALVLMTS